MWYYTFHQSELNYKIALGFREMQPINSLSWQMRMHSPLHCKWENVMLMLSLKFECMNMKQFFESRKRMRSRDGERGKWNGNSFAQLKWMEYLISEEDIIFFPLKIKTHRMAEWQKGTRTMKREASKSTRRIQLQSSSQYLAYVSRKIEYCEFIVRFFCPP